jgi:hypothetical protein
MNSKPQNTRASPAKPLDFHRYIWMDCSKSSEGNTLVIMQHRPHTFVDRAVPSILLPAVFLACATFGTRAASAQGTLVAAGKPVGCVVIEEDLEKGRVKTAVDDLVGYIRQMSGAQLPVRWETDDAPGFRIYIGSTRLAQVEPADVTEQKIGFDGFVIKTVPGGVLIAGRTDRGTAYGVYHFAEEVLGIHWYTLEESGPTIPSRSTLDIPTLDMTVKADFAWRGQYYSIITKYLPASSKANRDAWWRFNRLWGIDGLMAHVFGDVVPNSLFAEHPEYFALLKGKRTKGNVNVQRCISNPAVLQLAIDFSANYFEKYPSARFTSLSGNDGGGWCECDACVAMGPTQSHRSFAFANAVATALEDRYPNRGLCVLAYQKTLEPPMDMKIHRNVVPFIAPMGSCRAHSILSDCPDAIKKRNIFIGWEKLTGRFFWYPYLYGGPFTGPGVITMAEEMRFVRDHGCQGGFREHTAGPQANWAMLNWMEVKLQWDIDLDPVKLRRQFIEGYYGPAAVDLIEKVYDVVETGIRNTSIAPRPGVPYGHNYLNPPVLDPLVAACRKDLDAALEIARNEKNKAYARRIARDMGALIHELPPDLQGLLKE